MLLPSGIVFADDELPERDLDGNTTHTHQADLTWSSDSENHWHNCTGCSEKLDIALHTWDNGTVTTEPTTNSTGVRTFRCTVCSAVRTETIPAVEKEADPGIPEGTVDPTPAGPEIPISSDKDDSELPEEPIDDDPADDSPTIGTTFTVSGSTYQVTSNATDDLAASFVNSANKKSVSVPASVKYDGRSYNVTSIGVKAFTGKSIRTVTVGKNVSMLAKYAWKGSKSTKIVIKSKVLTKSGMKGSLKGSKVKTVKVSVGSKSANKKFVKKYRKFFTKANCGKKVSVK